LPASAFVNKSMSIVPQITDESEFSTKYYLDDRQINLTNATLDSINDGLHHLKVEATDEVGNTSTQTYDFTVDNTPPSITIKSPTNNMMVSDKLIVDFTVEDDNPIYNGTAILFGDQIIQNKTHAELDIGNFTEGAYNLVIFAKDKADNTNQKLVSFEIGKTPAVQTEIDQNLIFLLIIGIAAIVTASVVAFAAKSRKPSK
jgi:hypothetical protein